MSTNGLYHKLRQEIDMLPIVSTHEHNLVPPADEPVTLEYIFGHAYVRWCISADEMKADREAFLRKIKVNSYYRWLLFALRELYEFTGELTLENWDEISHRITTAHGDSEWYFKIMKEHGGIKRAILDAYWSPGSDNGHGEFYSPAFRVNSLVMSYAPEVRDHNGNSGFELLARHGMAVQSFDDYLGAIEALLIKKQGEGSVALKSALAYDRSLFFAEVPRDVAQGVFDKQGRDVSPEEAKAFGDFIFRFIAAQAGELNLPLQCHVGLGQISGSNPMNLIPLIEAYPKTVFVLLHGGYPWFHELGGLLHNYKNVYADMVWLPLISPTAARQTLHEWIEIAQTAEKISWGGDAWTPEETYGGVLAMRHTLAKVLAEKVEEGYFDRNIALQLAKQIMSDNAVELYGLG